ncbi:MAG: alkane 1-monooxygenase [Paracoccaceae bacterium]
MQALRMASLENRASARPAPAVAFWISLVFVPLIAVAAWLGGAWLLLIPLYSWFVMSLLDKVFGLDRRNADPGIPDRDLPWHRAVTLIWLPVQIALIYGCIAVATVPDHLTTGEALALMVCLGIVTGGVGIVYAHELIHQRSRLERRLGEWLLISVLYGHFRTEHLFVHHVHVGTPRDAVTARYNEGFYRFFARVLPGCLVSAWRIEAERLARLGLPVWSRRNPFWRYIPGALACLAAAWALGGWYGVGLYAVQAFTAVLHLELVNYVEHYGLVRLRTGEGKYEPVGLHHSWNAAHRFTNFLFINLQRHSDHHYKPDRRFPLLQHHAAAEAPQQPFGYPIMTTLALNPPLWRRVMNKRVRAWRQRFYPQVSDWSGWPELPETT